MVLKFTHEGLEEKKVQNVLVIRAKVQHKFNLILAIRTFLLIGISNLEIVLKS